LENLRHHRHASHEGKKEGKESQKKPAALKKTGGEGLGERKKKTSIFPGKLPPFRKASWTTKKKARSWEAGVIAETQEKKGTANTKQNRLKPGSQKKSPIVRKKKKEEGTNLLWGEKRKGRHVPRGGPPSYLKRRRERVFSA